MRGLETDHVILGPMRGLKKACGVGTFIRTGMTRLD